MIRIHQIYVSLDEHMAHLKEACAKKLKIPVSEILSYRIVKESIDARKQVVRLSYIVDCAVKDENRFLHLPDVKIAPDESYPMPTCGNKQAEGRIVIAGFGPAGMFAALLLAEMGYCPLVLERGEDVDHRLQKVERFWKEGKLDPNCNVQFGEGGAGTFSDGKLTARTKDLRSHKVLETFVAFGAPKEILYTWEPHIGSDRLRMIVKRIRQRIIELGGEVRFSTQLHDLCMENGKITKIKANEEWITCKALILAIGHSARDTFSVLEQHSVKMEQKSFAVGVRVEHPQAMINQAQWKRFADHPKLSAASYRLTHTTSTGRGVYTFCMCPGGTVVAGASQLGGVVTNGMSDYARDKENANSAILVQVHPNDVGKHILDGIRFQQNLEQKAFEAGGKNYYAPAQLIKDFMNDVPSTKPGEVLPTYRPGIRLCALSSVLPPFVYGSIQEALPVFDHKLHGFLYPDAILTAVETRSSSPIRLLRHSETLESVGCAYLYPCGEGAGYAGGIVSAAIDGLRCAEKIIQVFGK